RCCWSAGDLPAAEALFRAETAERGASAPLLVLLRAVTSGWAASGGQQAEAADDARCPRCRRGAVEGASRWCPVCGTDAQSCSASRARERAEPIREWGGVASPRGSGEEGPQERVGPPVEEEVEQQERSGDGPDRPLLYVFQHSALRDAAFENHPELIRELS